MAKPIKIKIEGDATSAIQATKDVSNAVKKMSVNADKGSKKIKDSLGEGSGGGGLFGKGNLLKIAGWGAAIGAACKVATDAIIGMGRAFNEQFIKPAAEYQKTMGQFKTLLGGDERVSRAYVGELNKYGAETHYSNAEVYGGAKSLLTYGIGGDESIKRLKQIGDIAAVSERSLSEIAQIYGQVASLGKLTGERVNQFSERGIDVRGELAKRDNITTEEVSKRISKGEYGLDDLNDVLDRVTGEGGAFHKGAENLAKTWDGLLSTFEGTLEAFAVKLGSEVIPALSAPLESLIKWMDENEELVSNTFADIGAAISGVVQAIIDAAKWCWNAGENISNFFNNLLGSLGAFGDVIKTVGETIWSVIKWIEEHLTLLGIVKRVVREDYVKPAVAQSRERRAKEAEEMKSVSLDVKPTTPTLTPEEIERQKAEQEAAEAALKAEKERKKRAEEFAKREAIAARKAGFDSVAEKDLGSRKQYYIGQANLAGVNASMYDDNQEIINRLEAARLIDGLEGKDVAVFDELIANFKALSEAAKDLKKSEEERELERYRMMAEINGNEGAAEDIKTLQDLRAAKEKYQSMGYSEPVASKMAEEDVELQQQLEASRKGAESFAQVSQSGVEVGNGGVNLRIGDQSLTVQKQQLEIAEESRDFLRTIKDGVKNWYKGAGITVTA